MVLTVAKIRALKPSERAYKVADHGGLYLNVSPTGARSWRYNFRHGDRAKTLSLGQFPEVGLLEARAALTEAKAQLAQCIDPAEAKRLAARGKEFTPDGTFAAAFGRWFERKLPLWEPRNARNLGQRFKDDVLPSIGDKQVGEIAPGEVLAIVRAIEGRGAVNMARRMRGAMSEVFRFAVAEGLAERDPSRDIDAALAPRPKVERRRALPPERMGAFMVALEAYCGEPIVTLALKFQILTWARPIEATSAPWSEFEDLDGDNPLWRIPAARMKARREHVVPLSPQAVAVLKDARTLSAGTHTLSGAGMNRSGATPCGPGPRRSSSTRSPRPMAFARPAAHGQMSPDIIVTQSSWRLRIWMGQFAASITARRI